VKESPRGIRVKVFKAAGLHRLGTVGLNPHRCIQNYDAVCSWRLFMWALLITHITSMVPRWGSSALSFPLVRARVQMPGAGPRGTGGHGSRAGASGGHQRSSTSWSKVQGQVSGGVSLGGVRRDRSFPRAQA